MKRTCLLSTAAIVASLCTASVASAETKPAIVYIPTADVDLIPSGTVDTVCEKASMSADIGAAGCVGNLAEATTRSPNGDVESIVEGVTSALEAYDITVVTEAPPIYVPVYAVLTGADDSEESVSHTCAGAALTCAARGRDSVAFTNTGTMNCTDPDLVQSTLYAIGRLAGLEGKEDATDVMFYPPDYENPVTAFVDACGPISQFLGGDAGDMPAPLECTSADHEGDCGAGEQNSNADMLAYFGAAAPDADAPEIAIESPADGDVIAEGAALQVIAKVDDASTYAAVSITVAAAELEGQIPGGAFTFCTTDLCDVNFLDNDPFKVTDSEWATSELSQLPGGEYTITLEASDYHGNVAEPLVITVTVEGGPVDPSGGDDTGTGGDDSGGQTSAATNGDSGFLTSGGDESGGGSDTEGGSGGASDDGGGCAVATQPGIGGTMGLMLGLFGLGFVRRRR